MSLEDSQYNNLNHMSENHSQNSSLQHDKGNKHILYTEYKKAYNEDLGKINMLFLIVWTFASAYLINGMLIEQPPIALDTSGTYTNLTITARATYQPYLYQAYLMLGCCIIGLAGLTSKNVSLVGIASYGILAYFICCFLGYIAYSPDMVGSTYSYSNWLYTLLFPASTLGIWVSLHQLQKRNIIAQKVIFVSSE